MSFLDAYLDEGVGLALALANATSAHRRGAPARPAEALAGAGVRLSAPTALARVSVRFRQVVEQSGPEAAASLINAVLRDYRAAPELAPDVRGRWRLHLHARDASLETLDVIKAAAGLAALVDADQWLAVKLCRADRCDDVFVDRSRNRSRRYCGRTCANRTNAGAARTRRRP